MPTSSLPLQAHPSSKAFSPRKRGLPLPPPTKAHLGQAHRQDLARRPLPLPLLWPTHEDHRRHRPGRCDRTDPSLPQPLGSALETPAEGSRPPPSSMDGQPPRQWERRGARRPSTPMPSIRVSTTSSSRSIPSPRRRRAGLIPPARAPPDKSSILETPRNGGSGISTSLLLPFAMLLAVDLGNSSPGALPWLPRRLRLPPRRSAAWLPPWPAKALDATLSTENDYVTPSRTPTKDPADVRLPKVPLNAPRRESGELGHRIGYRHSCPVFQIHRFVPTFGPEALHSSVKNIGESVFPFSIILARRGLLDGESKGRNGLQPFDELLMAYLAKPCRERFEPSSAPFTGSCGMWPSA